MTVAVVSDTLGMNRLITGLRRPDRHSITGRRDAPANHGQHALSTLS
jgi:hypothetical protein